MAWVICLWVALIRPDSIRSLLDGEQCVLAGAASFLWHFVFGHVTLHPSGSASGGCPKAPMQSRPGRKGIVHLVHHEETSWLTCTEQMVEKKLGTNGMFGGGGGGEGLRAHEEIALKLLEPTESFRMRVLNEVHYRRREPKWFSGYSQVQTVAWPTLQYLGINAIKNSVTGMCQNHAYGSFIFFTNLGKWWLGSKGEEKYYFCLTIVSLERIKSCAELSLKHWTLFMPAKCPKLGRPSAAWALSSSQMLLWRASRELMTDH